MGSAVSQSRIGGPDDRTSEFSGERSGLVASRCANHNRQFSLLQYNFLQKLKFISPPVCAELPLADQRRLAQLSTSSNVCSALRMEGVVTLVESRKTILPSRAGFTKRSQPGMIFSSAARVPASPRAGLV